VPNNPRAAARTITSGTRILLWRGFPAADTGVGGTVNDVETMVIGS